LLFLTFRFLDARAAAQLVKEADIHVVTGLLKLYFRELPEALFTDALYPELLTGMGRNITALTV
jgi:breakpoint cluster region protein